VSQPARVLVVEDEESLAEGLVLNLGLKGYQVDMARDGRQALAKVAAERYDLVLLDVRLPEVDGFAVCQRLRGERNFTPILMLTARSQPDDVVYGLKLGADDYVTKPFNPRELVARVKAVLRRSQGAIQTDAPLEVGDVRLDPARREVTVGGKPVTLRAKEFDLLAAFMRHPGVVLDRERLLQMVWGTDYFGDTRTIDVHVAWLRDKLSGAERVKIQTVWGVGYKLVVDQDAQEP
jgi:DNA-binding response OmpR family regulator